MKRIKGIIACLHFVVKLAWWVVALGFIFLCLPKIMSWVDNLILSTPIQYAEIELWPLPWTINLGLSNHDFMGIIPLWFLASGLGIVVYRYYKTIKWITSRTK